MELFFGDDVQRLFSDLLNDIDCHEFTKSYLISILTKYKSAQLDYSKDSITLLFGNARDRRDFHLYQSLGDWLFFSSVCFPKHLKHADQSYYRDITRLSYYGCYELINRQVKIYQELADQLILLETEVKERLKILR